MFKCINGAVRGFLFMLLLGLASCSDEQDLISQVGNEMTTNISIQVPDGLGSRAVPDVYPENTTSYAGESGYPSIGNVDLNAHPLSFTVGVYVEKADGSYALVDQIQSKTGVKDDKADFNFRLLKGQEYRIVAYADFSDTAKENLDNISITPKLNDELTDAFFVSEKFTAKEHLTVVLKRPFGKLRLIARDFSNFATGEVQKINSIKVTYANTATALATNSFNAITGEFNEAETSINEYTADPIIYTLEHSGETTPYAAVFTMYLPVNKGVADTSSDYTPVEDGTEVPQSWMYPFDIEVTYTNLKNEETTIKRSFDIDIPIKRNWLTTIDAADFWTDNSNITVSIDHRFDGFISVQSEPATVKTANELQDAIDKICNEASSKVWNTARIILGADIDADQNERIATPGGFVFDSNKAINIYLDLNGHKITTKGVSTPTYNPSYLTTPPATPYSVGGVIGINNWNNRLYIEDNNQDQKSPGGIYHEGEAGAIFYPLIRCMNGGQVVINEGNYISNSTAETIYVYEQEVHHYQVLGIAYKTAYTGFDKLESGGYPAPTQSQIDKIKTRTEQLTAKATINGGWFQNAHTVSTYDEKNVVINSYNPREEKWNQWNKLKDTYGSWADWGTYTNHTTFGYVYLNGGTYVDYDPAHGDNVGYNYPNKWVNDAHTVLQETVDGKTVFTVIPKDSPEYY